VTALADRVAKLERAAMHCNACGGRCDGDCEEGDEQFENERLASGQLASAGAATVPKRCMTMMQGLPCGRPFKYGKCTVGHLEPHDEQPSRQETGGGEPGEAIDWSRFLPTEEIAEDMALVGYDALTRGDVFASWDVVHGGNVNRSLGIDRAETLAGGGCWWQRRVRLIRHADGRWADGYHGASVDATGSATEFEAGPCRPDCGSSDGCKSKPCFFVHAGKTYHFCTPFCRARFEADRAKAKAAEQAHPSVNFTYPEATCLCRGDGSKCHHGSCQLPEQSGTGQLPGAPVGFRVVRESGPDVPIPTDDTMIVFARYSHDRHDTGNEPRRADDGRQTDRRLWDAGCYDILEPIAEPPAPAVGTRGDVDGNASCSTCGYPPRWCECSVPPDDCVKLTTAEGRVAALEARLAQAEERVKRQTDWYQQRFNRLRKWVDEEVRPLSADVATRYFSICANGSPAPHESADWTDTMHALRLQLAQAERERDERGRQVEQMAEHVAAMRVERDAAVALLRDGDTGCDGSDDGDDDPPCWGCRASALLSRIENVHG
jgi:hypothetical protein